jgi:hypothetical protein
MRLIRTITACVVVACSAGGALASDSFARIALDSEGLGPPAASPSSASAPTTPSTYVSPLLAKEIRVLTAQGISLGRAERAIAVQGKLGHAALGRKLHAAMGSTYAGVWFEPAAAKTHVGVTSPESRRTAEEVVMRAGLRPNVIFSPVRSPMAQLLAVQERWNRKLASLFRHADVTTGLEPQRNAVSVTLSSLVPTRRRAILKREASLAHVNVLVSVATSPKLGMIQDAKECNNFPAANCNRSITAGVRITRPNGETGKGEGESHKTETVDGFEVATLAGVLPGDEITGPGIPAETIVVAKPNNKSVTISEKTTTAQKAIFTFLTGSECTAGPAAIPEANNNLRVLLTAGHCLQSGHGTGAEWSAFNRAGEKLLIGKAGSFVNGGAVGGKLGDFGEIAIEAGGQWQTGNPQTPVLAVTAEWKKNEETRYPVIGEKEPEAKVVSCHEGATSGESCGLINGFNKTIADALGTAEGLVEVIEPAGAAERLIGEGGDSGGAWLFIGKGNQAQMEGTYEGRLSPECPKVKKLIGPQFFPTEEACLKGKEQAGNEGEFERRLRLLFDPLKKPAGTAVQGSLEALKLILLTTANETIPGQAGGLLPEKTNFAGTGKTNKIVALGGTEIKCEATNILSGTMETDHHGTVDIHFEKCKAFGLFEANSLGDKAGVILSVDLWLLCLITPTTLVWGIWLEPAKPLHLETAGKLLTIKGGLIGKIVGNSKSLKKTITFTQKAGDTATTSCVGMDGKTKTANQTIEEDKGKPESSALEGEATTEAEDKKTELEIMDPK